MQGRHLLVIGAMWVVALGAVTFLVLQEERTPAAGGRRVETAPTHRHDDEAAPRRATLPPVGADDESPRAFRGGRRHTGRSPFRGPSSGRVAWRVDAGGRVTAQPIRAPGDRVVVGSHAGRLLNLDLAGNVRWVVEDLGAIWSAAAVDADGGLVVASDAEAILAFRADGGPRWRLGTGTAAETAVTVGPDGDLHLAAGSQLLRLAADGTPRWRFLCRSGVLGAPAVDADGTVYVGDQSGTVHAVAPDGRPRWTVRTGRAYDTGVTIGDGGLLHLGSDDHHVVGITRAGEVRWRTDVGGIVRAPLALDRDGGIIASVYGPSPRIVRLDAEDGAVTWSYALTRQETGSDSGPVVDGEGAIYVGGGDGFVYGLTADGQLRWITEIGAPVEGTPLLAADGLLLVGSEQGTVTAVGRR